VKLSDAFAARKEQGGKTNIIYLTPEYPYDDMTVPLVCALAENNVHVVELGVPFSDPLADGPTIQKASFHALQKKINLARILELVKAIRAEGCKIPLVLMSYINPIISYGLDRFVAEGRAAGVSGVIIPDLPVDELEGFREAFSDGPDLVLLAAPTSTKQRLRVIASGSRGFIYCVSLTGVTGARDSSFIGHETEQFLDEIRSISSLPIAVGFGISSAAHVDALWDHCDGFIVGSAFIKALEKGVNRDDAIRYGLEFVNNVFKR